MFKLAVVKIFIWKNFNMLQICEKNVSFSGYNFYIYLTFFIDFLLLVNILIPMSENFGQISPFSKFFGSSKLKENNKI